MPAGQFLDRDTAPDDLAALVDAVRRQPEGRRSLVELLPERHPMYAGRSRNETMRMRGYILAAFEEVGLPDAALLYAIEELESGREAYLVAAAAKALRGLDGREPRIVPFLFKAIRNMRLIDDAVTFDAFWPQRAKTGHTTALIEIFRTFEWLGSHARQALPQLQELCDGRDAFSPDVRVAIARAIDAIQDGEVLAEVGCCGPNDADSEIRPLDRDSVTVLARAERRSIGRLASIEFEDQDGSPLTYAEAFTRRPTVVVFFYTRCDNPNKCSLTVTKLARLQRAIGEAGWRARLATAAITYDPGFDLPPRLRSYGAQRGVVFDDQNRFLRTRAGFDAVKAHFELGVNFGQAVVNRHRIELFILDEEGRIAVTAARRQWDVDDVLRLAASMLAPERPRGGPPAETATTDQRS